MESTKKNLDELEGKEYVEEVSKGWRAPKSFNRKEWRDNLQPNSKFIEVFGYKGEHWQSRTEYVINRDIDQRVRISFEHAPYVYAYNISRDEQLRERGLDVSTLDADEFAQDLMKTLFYHTSPRQMKSIVKAMLVYLRDWDVKRMATYPDLESFLTDLDKD